MPMDMIGGSDKEPDAYDENEDSEKFDAAAAKEEASKALIRALANKDWKAVNDSLSSHYKACKLENEEE